MYDGVKCCFINIMENFFRVKIVQNLSNQLSSSDGVDLKCRQPRFIDHDGLLYISTADFAAPAREIAALPCLQG